MSRSNAISRSWKATLGTPDFDLFPILAFDLRVARQHARIWAELRRQGLLIGAHDLMIAATAIHHGLSVVTYNQREFSRVDGLQLTIWSQS